MADGDISTQAEAQSLAGVGVADDFDLAAEVTNHADKVLKASGSALKHYTMPSAKRAILSAMMDAMEAAYRAGAKFAERLYEDRFTRLTEANAAQAREIEGLREALTPKPKGTDCPQSPTGFHIVDTSMESGSNNCFHCEADLRGYVPGAAVRPTQPMGEDSLWYRGWEAGYDDMAARYVKECWIAYKGGCDLDARTITASSWNALLDEIDAEMEGTDNGD